MTFNDDFDFGSLSEHIGTLINYYYEIPGHESGGNLRAVLEKGDFDQLLSCIEACGINDDTLGMMICEIFVKTPIYELYRLYTNNWDRLCTPP